MNHNSGNQGDYHHIDSGETSWVFTVHSSSHRGYPTKSLTLSLSHTHTHTHTHKEVTLLRVSLSLSLSHTHTHTHKDPNFFLNDKSIHTVYVQNDVQKNMYYITFITITLTLMTVYKVLLHKKVR